jgi:hypothetical protein
MPDLQTSVLLSLTVPFFLILKINIKKGEGPNQPLFLIKLSLE